MFSCDSAVYCILFFYVLQVSVSLLCIKHHNIAGERHRIAHLHKKVHVSVTKLRVSVCHDTKCRLVSIKLRVARLPRLRLSGAMPQSSLYFEHNLRES